jgi:hypothetical protein
MTLVAVGDRNLGAAVLLQESDPHADRIAEITAELRRILGEC